MRKPRFLHKFFATPLRTVGLILIVAAILAGFWYFNNPVRKTTATIPSVNSKTSAPAQPSARSTGSSSSSTAVTVPDKSTAVAASPSPNQPLVDPYGTFVSNHHPDSSSSSEASACNTTPGAACYIKFTNGNLTRTLDQKVADGNGTVVWSWDIKDAGFSSGSWQVSAVATLNGQTKTSTDQQALVIP